MKITKDIDFILMACDGVWDCVDIQKLCEHISLRLKSHFKISDIIAELFDQIISKSNNSKILLIVAPVGTDNMSCILIQFLHE
jgi:protein phosphatase 2C family protein 2/3